MKRERVNNIIKQKRKYLPKWLVSDATLNDWAQKKAEDESWIGYP